MNKRLESIDSGNFSVEHPDLDCSYELYGGTIDQGGQAYVMYYSKEKSCYKLFVGKATLEEAVIEEVKENWGMAPIRLAVCGTTFLWKSKNSKKGELKFQPCGEFDDVYGWVHVKDEAQDVYLEKYL